MRQSPVSAGHCCLISCMYIYTMSIQESFSTFSCLIILIYSHLKLKGSWMNSVWSFIQQHHIPIYESPIFSYSSISFKTSCTDLCSTGAEVLLNPTPCIPVFHNLVYFTFYLMPFSSTSKAHRDHGSVSGHGESVSNWLWMVLMAISGNLLLVWKAPNPSWAPHPSFIWD